jgi:hypothetical protein
MQHLTTSALKYLENTCCIYGNTNQINFGRNIGLLNAGADGVYMFITLQNVIEGRGTLFTSEDSRLLSQLLIFHCKNFRNRPRKKHYSVCLLRAFKYTTVFRAVNMNNFKQNRTSETSVYYNITRRYIPEGYHLLYI